MIVRFLVLCGCTLLFSTFAVSADKPNELVSSKKVLSSKLDSLEVEKQLKKRGGKPIDALELESTKIRDSITSLRQKISSGGAGLKNKEAASLQASQDDGEDEIENGVSTGTLLRAIVKPKEPIDWLILLIALIAVGAGVILTMSTRQLSVMRKIHLQLHPGQLDIDTAEAREPMAVVEPQQSMKESKAALSRRAAFSQAEARSEKADLSVKENAAVHRPGRSGSLYPSFDAMHNAPAPQQASATGSFKPLPQQPSPTGTFREISPQQQQLQQQQQHFHQQQQAAARATGSFRAVPQQYPSRTTGSFPVIPPQQPLPRSTGSFRVVPPQQPLPRSTGSFRVVPPQQPQPRATGSFPVVPPQQQQMRPRQAPATGFFKAVPPQQQMPPIGMRPQTNAPQAPFGMQQQGQPQQPHVPPFIPQQNRTAFGSQPPSRPIPPQGASQQNLPGQQPPFMQQRGGAFQQSNSSFPTSPQAGQPPHSSPSQPYVPGTTQSTMKVQYIRETIVKMANQGMAIGDIAQRFQLSVDQVALIIRVGRNQR